MNWEMKRKIIYALIGIVILVALAVFLMRDTIFPAPTCFDTKQNGYESGIDCGGVCSLRCTEEVKPLSVAWAKAVYSGGEVYDLVALVANSNINNASRELRYTFTLYNENGQKTGELSGSTVAPLDGKFPLILQNIPLQKAPANVIATLADGPHYTVTEKPTSPTVKIIDKHYEAGSIPKIYATVMNTKRLEITNLQIRTLLYDDKENVYAVGQTIIPRL